MKQRLSSFAVGLSLVLCLITTALWIRSYYVDEILAIKVGPGTLKLPWRGVAIVSGNGGIAFHYRSAGMDPLIVLEGWIPQEFPAFSQHFDSFQIIAPGMTYITATPVAYPYYDAENSDGCATVGSKWGFQWASDDWICSYACSRIYAVTMPYAVLVCLLGLLPLGRLLQYARQMPLRRRGFEVISKQLGTDLQHPVRMALSGR